MKDYRAQRRLERRREKRAAHAASAAQRSQRRQLRHRNAVDGVGDPCPTCGCPMQVREHVGGLTAKQMRQPYHFTRWFSCLQPDCPTTLVMAERFKVWHSAEPPPDEAPADDIVMAVAAEMAKQESMT
jgi:hypothetical protein